MPAFAAGASTFILCLPGFLTARLACSLGVSVVLVHSSHILAAYELVKQTFVVKPEQVMCASSCSFDTTAAGNSGFQLVWIRPVTPDAMHSKIASRDTIAPSTMFRVIRMQQENFEIESDYCLSSLTDSAFLTR